MTRLFYIAETVTTIPTETNQKPKPAVTKTAVSASQTQTKTGIDKYTSFFFLKLSNENSRLDVPIDEIVIFSVHKFNIVMCYFINFFPLFGHGCVGSTCKYFDIKNALQGPLQLDLQRLTGSRNQQ